MQRLSGTDSLFLAGETPAWHQHVAGLAIIDTSGVPNFCFDAVVRSVSERLPLIPKLTWKLREVPFGLHRAVRERPLRLSGRSSACSWTGASRCGRSGISTAW